MALLSQRNAYLQSACRVVAGSRRMCPRLMPAKLAVSHPCHRHRQSLVRLQAALVEEAPAETSFTTLLDDEDEYEMVDEGFEAEEAEAADIDTSLFVDNLGLSEEVVRALKKRGINALFPIQGLVFGPAMEGRDLIGRAKTGSGKTLAFALPVVENLLAEDKERKGRKAPGRSPRCLILAPTRELAKQVASEFESVCPSLTVVSFYGGTSINAQIMDLKRGVDVVVGTPGRIMDLLDRKKLVGDQVRYVILDEADQMLDMGFQDDMEVILQQLPEERQTMLFSATLPSWVTKVAKRYQKDPTTIDLVGEEQTGKLNEDVTLNIMQVSQSEKRQALLDILSVYAAGGKAIVFTKTKTGCDEVAAAVSQQTVCEGLHGDIPQNQREKTLNRFRKGDVSVLVATDVAARGLDIPSVDLVVHYDMPNDSEAFLHRSGRTARAGNKGRAIVMYTPSETRSLGLVLQQVKLTSGEVIGAPSPADVMASASRTVLSKLDRVENQVIDFFMPAATRLIQSPQPERVLAAALAAMSGFRTVAQERSLLTGEIGYSTLKLMASAGMLDGFNSTARFIEKFVGGSVGNQIGKLRILSGPDGEGVAVDLPANLAAAVLQSADRAAAMGVVISKPSSLPLDIKEMVLGRQRGGPPRADRSFGSRGGGYRGGSRDRDGGYGSRSRDSYSGRGYNNRDGGYSNGRGSSRGGGSGGGNGYISRDAGYGSGRGNSSSSRSRGGGGSGSGGGWYDSKPSGGWTDSPRGGGGRGGGKGIW